MMTRKSTIFGLCDLLHARDIVDGNYEKFRLLKFYIMIIKEFIKTQYYRKYKSHKKNR